MFRWDYNLTEPFIKWNAHNLSFENDKNEQLKISDFCKYCKAATYVA